MRRVLHSGRRVIYESYCWATYFVFHATECDMSSPVSCERHAPVRASLTVFVPLHRQFGVVNESRCGQAVITGLGAVAGVSVWSGGVGVAAPNPFADRSASKVTDDGWRVTAVKAHEKVRSVPPLNQSSWTREGFMSLKGQAVISGRGRVAVDAGTVTAGYQIGCNTDVTSGLTMGVMGGPTAQMSISYPPAAIIGAQIMPNVSTTQKPGTIADISFGTEKLAGQLPKD